MNWPFCGRSPRLPGEADSFSHLNCQLLVRDDQGRSGCPGRCCWVQYGEPAGLRLVGRYAGVVYVVGVGEHDSV